MADAFTGALARLQNSGAKQHDFSAPFLDVFPVTGAAVSTVGDFLGSETLSATDGRAARLDELQFDLGEGPCWDALRLSRPILEPDVVNHPRIVWPAFSPAMREQHVGAIFAFPLTVGSLRIGAVDLYSVQPVTFDDTHTRQATAMADVVSRHVLRNALAAVDVDEHPVSAYSRRLIHQATGMVLAQLDLSPDDARLVIHGHAFAEGKTAQEVAQEVLDGRLSFAVGESGFEVVE
jgi:GAF domain-containing protein